MLGLLCDELVLGITANNVADASEISLKDSERNGHLAQVDAIKAVQAGVAGRGLGAVREIGRAHV